MMPRTPRRSSLATGLVVALAIGLAANISDRTPNEQAAIGELASRPTIEPYQGAALIILGSIPVLPSWLP